MARNQGTFNFSSNFEPNIKAPIDARIVVEYLSDLTSSAQWIQSGNNWLYDGIIVSVTNDSINNGAYYLQDSNNYNIISNWIKLSNSLNFNNFVVTSSIANDNTTASYALNALSSSYALTASYVPNITNFDYSFTSSFVVTSSIANDNTTASYALNALSSSYALTASYVPNITNFDYSFTSSFVTTNSFNNSTGSFVTTNSFNDSTGSFVVTSSIANDNTTASYALNALSSSYALTASYISNVTNFDYSFTSSFVTTNSFNSSTGSFVVTSSIANDNTTASYALNALSSSYALNGGDGKSIRATIMQSSHGFVAEDTLRHNGSAWVKAQADSAVNSEAIGVVESSVDTDNFVIVYGGEITLSGLTAGSEYFLAAVTAGATTTTAPSSVGQIVRSIMIAISTTKAIVRIQQPGIQVI
jgi:sorbitol-specific phosphotransferase system component IIC